MEWETPLKWVPKRKPAKGQMGSVYRVNTAPKLKLDIVVFK